MANEDKKLHGSTCALCGNKVKLLDRNYLHMLSDGPLCQKCHMTILQLLTQRRWWISEAEYMQVMQKNYSIRQTSAAVAAKVDDKRCGTLFLEVDDSLAHLFCAALGETV